MILSSCHCILLTCYFIGFSQLFPIFSTINKEIVIIIVIVVIIITITIIILIVAVVIIMIIIIYCQINILRALNTVVC